MNFAHKSVFDIRDTFAQSVFKLKSTPPLTLDLRPRLPIVRNQSNSSQCVAFATCVIAEYNDFNTNHKPIFFNTSFIYNKRPNKNIRGMSPRDAMHILYKYGAISSYDQAVNENVDIIASSNKIKGYACVLDIKNLKKALFHNGPCLWTGPMFNKKSIRMWDIKTAHSTKTYSDHIYSTHAMAIVGYNHKGFILRNSFGSKWGHNGYCIFPYTDWGKQTEIWTCTNGQNNHTNETCCSIL